VGTVMRDTWDAVAAVTASGCGQSTKPNQSSL